MRMSAEGFKLLARIEAPSPGPASTTGASTSTYYKTNSSGKITQVKNQDIGDGAITVGYGLAVKKGNDGTTLRNYLAEKKNRMHSWWALQSSVAFHWRYTFP